MLKTVPTVVVIPLTSFRYSAISYSSASKDQVHTGIRIWAAATASSLTPWGRTGRWIWCLSMRLILNRWTNSRYCPMSTRNYWLTKSLEGPKLLRGSIAMSKPRKWGSRVSQETTMNLQWLPPVRRSLRQMDPHIYASLDDPRTPGWILIRRQPA